MLTQIIQNCSKKQFDKKYNIAYDVDKSLKQSPPTTQSHIKDMIEFKYHEHPLFDVNTLRDFYTQSNLAAPDPEKYLETVEYDQLFGAENITSSEIDPSSDFVPNEKIDVEIVVEIDVNADSDTVVETDSVTKSTLL